MTPSTLKQASQQHKFLYNGTLPLPAEDTTKFAVATLNR